MAALLLFVSMFAVDPPAVLGWQPASEGGREYLIQIAPETLEQLRQGAAVRGTLPLPGGGSAYYRVTVGRGAVPRRDGESTTTGRISAEEPMAGGSSGRWAAPAAAEATSAETAGPPGSAGSRSDVPQPAAGARRIEDLPDALSPKLRSVEPGTAASRLGDLPPLERSDSVKIGATAQRNDQEYRPPGVGFGAADAITPRASAEPAKPADAVGPPTSAERGGSPPRPLLPISDIDRATVKPSERSTNAPAATPLAMPNAAGDAASVGSGGPTNRTPERPPSTAPSGNQPPETATSAGQTIAAPETKPWGTLVFVGALLFASLGLNFFLGWTAWDYRRRCESLTMAKNDGGN